MKQAIDTKTFDRADMFNRFMNYSNPIGSISATVKINKLIKYKKRGHKLNALLNYCILKAVHQIKEFHYAYENNILFLYDDIAMMGVVFGQDKHLYLARWNYFNNFNDFENNYIKINKKIYENNKSEEFKDTAIVSSSAFVEYPIDSAVINMDKDITHTYFTWGGYRKSFFNCFQSITVRFHHAFFDGGHISKFFFLLQKEIDELRI